MSGGVKVQSLAHFCTKMLTDFNLFQLVPLHATLTVPQFTLSKESLDFGVCLVGQTRELQLMLSNLTSSHTQWSISQGQQ